MSYQNEDAVRLSVIIPHHNDHVTLPRTIASVVTRMAFPAEIIVVDDASADFCEPVLSALEASVHQLRVIRLKKNVGAPAAINTGLENATGEYVTFLGADDFIVPGFYQVAMKELEMAPGTGFVSAAAALLHEDGSMAGVRPFAAPSFIKRRLSSADVRKLARVSDNWVLSTVTVYRTDLVRAMSGFNPELGSFCDGFLVRELAFKHGFVFLPRVWGVWEVAGDTYSARTMTSVEGSIEISRLAKRELQRSCVGRAAPEYPRRFVKRLRFGASRLQLIWNAKKLTSRELNQVAGGVALDLRLFGLIEKHLGFVGLGGVLARFWLFLRLRPVALSMLPVFVIQNLLMKWTSAGSIERIRVELSAKGEKLAKSGGA